MSGLEKGKAAHIKLQGYINTLVPEVDQHHSIIFDRIQVYESFQRRFIVIENGNGYLCLSTDVDYTGYIHQTEDNENEPLCFHLPVEAIPTILNHRILSLEDDNQKLKSMIYVEPDYVHQPDIDEDC